MIQHMIRQNAAASQDQTEYNRRFDSFSQNFGDAEAKKNAIVEQISDIRLRQGTMEDFLSLLKKQDSQLIEFNEQLWGGLLDFPRPTRMAA